MKTSKSILKNAEAQVHKLYFPVVMDSGRVEASIFQTHLYCPCHYNIPNWKDFSVRKY